MRSTFAFDEDGDIQKKIAEREKRLDIAAKKKSKLLEYNVTGRISDKDFIEMNKQAASEIAQAARELAELEERRNNGGRSNAVRRKNLHGRGYGEISVETQKLCGSHVQIDA